MISRFLRRPPPPARIVYFSSSQYLRARAEGRGMVRVELPETGSSAAPHVAKTTAPPRPLSGGSGGAAESDPAAPLSAFDALAEGYARPAPGPGGKSSAGD